MAVWECILLFGICCKRSKMTNYNNKTSIFFKIIVPQSICLYVCVGIDELYCVEQFNLSYNKRLERITDISGGILHISTINTWQK